MWIDRYGTSQNIVRSIEGKGKEINLLRNATGCSMILSGQTSECQIETNQVLNLSAPLCKGMRKSIFYEAEWTLGGESHRSINNAYTWIERSKNARNSAIIYPKSCMPSPNSRSEA